MRHLGLEPTITGVNIKQKLQKIDPEAFRICN